MHKTRIFYLGLCLYLFNVSLSGAAPTPVPSISAHPASVNLGSVEPGASSVPRGIRVKNTGKSDLIISNVSTTGVDGDQFSQTNNCGTIQPGESCQVDVTFTPKVPYTRKTALLAIESNDSRKPTLTIKLSGLVPPPAISATPASLNFGKLPAGTANSSKSVTVKNNGFSDLVIESSSISGTNPGDFSATSNCGTIQKGETCTINVVFEPLAPTNASSASLDIVSNDPRKSTVSLKLSGSTTSAGSLTQAEAQAFARLFASASANAMGKAKQTMQQPALALNLQKQGLQEQTSPSFTCTLDQSGMPVCQFDIPVDYTSACPKGGDIHNIGSITGTINSTLSGVLLVAINETITDCGVSDFVINGDPSISMAGSYSFVNGKPADTQTLSIGGGFKTETQSIQILLTIICTADGHGTISGTIGGQSVNVSF